MAKEARTVSPEEKASENLYRASYKLHGIAGLFKVDDDSGRILEAEEADGLYWLLNQIAEEIQENIDVVTARQPKGGAGMGKTDE